VANGQSYSNLSIGTSESFVDRAGMEVKRTTWHRVVCWRGMADFANNYLIPGRLVYVEGRIQHRFYVDQYGLERCSTEIVATLLRALDPRPEYLPVFATMPKHCSDIVPEETANR
jgi:single-strand DNA-binding protein